MFRIAEGQPPVLIGKEGSSQALEAGRLAVVERLRGQERLRVVVEARMAQREVAEAQNASGVASVAADERGRLAAQKAARETGEPSTQADKAVADTEAASEQKAQTAAAQGEAMVAEATLNCARMSALHIATAG